MDQAPVSIPWLIQEGDDTLSLSVDTSIYSLDALFRTCYVFTDKCYLFLEPEEAPVRVRVRFSKKSESSDLRRVTGDFCNELINQRLRRDIAAETRAIRELIVAQAFAEADLQERPASESDYNADPKGIAK